MLTTTEITDIRKAAEILRRLGKDSWGICLTRIADRASAEHGRQGAGPYVHEDELPEHLKLTDELYAQSYIPGGVGCRVYPKWAVYEAMLELLSEPVTITDRKE